MEILQKDLDEHGDSTLILIVVLRRTGGSIYCCTAVTAGIVYHCLKYCGKCKYECTRTKKQEAVLELRLEIDDDFQG